MSKRIVIIILVILGASAAAHYFELDHYLTLSYIKQQHNALVLFYKTNPFQSYILYGLLYIITSALALPTAAILTLAAGSIFGFMKGTVIASVSATVGATVSFLLARHLLRNTIQNRYHHLLKKINKGIEKEGKYYLFSLRLVPISPFFVINFLSGLTPISTSAYFWVSLVSMLPGTAAYVNAGTQLSKVNNLADVLSTEIIISFALLAILPFTLKWFLNIFKKRRILSSYSKPKKFDYNLVVIGAGSGGLVSAYIAANAQAKVALIEKNLMGGDCLNFGCVPSKALIRTAQLMSDIKQAKELGVANANATFDLGHAMDRVQRVIKSIEPHDSVERYTKLGVECIEGEARLLNPYTVEVNGKKLTTKSIIIATGASPIVPNIEGLKDSAHYTSDNIWQLRQLPKHLVVLGGGPIGCELAQCFVRLGSKVTQVEMAAQILGREDQDVADTVSKKLSSDGVTILNNHKAIKVVQLNGESILSCDNNGKVVNLTCDAILVAIGRKANIRNLGLEELDIKLRKNKTIIADPFMRTNYPNIFVCGDVTGPYQFTHAASHQAWHAAINAILSPFWKLKIDYSYLPWATFTDPEISRVGLNESDAKQSGTPYEVTKFMLEDLDRAITDESTEGFLKVLTVPNSDKILGATIVGAHSSNYISELVLAMKHGIGLNKILSTVHIYPTLAEANKSLAGVWKKNHTPAKLLKWARRLNAWRIR